MHLSIKNIQIKGQAERSIFFNFTYSSTVFLENSRRKSSLNSNLKSRASLLLACLTACNNLGRNMDLISNNRQYQKSINAKSDILVYICRLL